MTVSELGGSPLRVCSAHLSGSCSAGRRTGRHRGKRSSESPGKARDRQSRGFAFTLRTVQRTCYFLQLHKLSLPIKKSGTLMKMSPPNTITTCFLVISSLNFPRSISVFVERARESRFALKIRTCAGSRRSVSCAQPGLSFCTTGTWDRQHGAMLCSGRDQVGGGRPPALACLQAPRRSLR